LIGVVWFLVDSTLRMMHSLGLLFLLALVLFPNNGSATSLRVEDQPVSISLGEPRQLFHNGEQDALGMRGVPDQPLTPMQQPDMSYRLFIAGGEIGGSRGSTGLISTKDFLTYTPVVGSQTEAQPVLTPSCRGIGDNPGPASCRDNFDANYAGVDLVFPSSSGNALFMIYQGTTKNFGTTWSDSAFYSEVALATSTDAGSTWTRDGQIITGSDPKPTTQPKPGAYGADQSGAIVANGYIYDFFPYFSNDGGDQGIEVARAPITTDGAAGSWVKYYQGSFGSQGGVAGLGSAVVPATASCNRPAQPWLAFSTYLNEYVMVFVCEEGWFLSASTDLISWSSPTQFYTAPVPLFTNGKETDENPSLVTPGNTGQVIGQTGYVLYANTPSWQGGVAASHMLWMRPFTFAKSPAQTTGSTTIRTTQTASPTTSEAVTSTSVVVTKPTETAAPSNTLILAGAALAIAVIAIGVYLLRHKRRTKT
jgi:hypothetical protein